MNIIQYIYVFCVIKKNDDEKKFGQKISRENENDREKN